jgi:hypothetical protein
MQDARPPLHPHGIAFCIPVSATCILYLASLLSKTGSQLGIEKVPLGVCKDFSRQNEIFENQEDMVDGTNCEPIQSNP